jgi:DNA-binding HxlR family transcriptional regulator
MKGYGQFCPVAKACEVLTERWTPQVLRELLCGSRRFNDLQRGVPLMSRSLLAKRLRELEDAGLVERRATPEDRRGNEYHLTPAGEEVRPIIESLGAWGQRWVVADVDRDDIDPSLLMWDIRRNVRSEELPLRRTVVRLEFTNAARSQRRWWLLFDADGCDVCMTNPGFEPDLDLTVDARDLTRYWIGRLTWSELMGCRDTGIRGPRWAQRSLPKWLGRSSFSEVDYLGEAAASKARGFRR